MSCLIVIISTTILHNAPLSPIMHHLTVDNNTPIIDYLHHYNYHHHHYHNNHHHHYHHHPHHYHHYYHHHNYHHPLWHHYSILGWGVILTARNTDFSTSAITSKTFHLLDKNTRYTISQFDTLEINAIVISQLWFWTCMFGFFKCVNDLDSARLSLQC